MFYKLFLTEFSLQMKGTFKASRLLYTLHVQGVLGGGRRTVSCHQLPASPSHCSAHCSALRPDSGFNSEAEAGSSGCSVGLYSGCLDHYGLDGPLVPLQEVSPSSCLLLSIMNLSPKL